MLSSRGALACGGDWHPEVQVDPRIPGVLEAEKAIAQANYIADAGSVLRMMLGEVLSKVDGGAD
ncbi:MAG: hypothetical protein ABI548_19345 [Polyangiaceae bacterium]